MNLRSLIFSAAVLMIANAFTLVHSVLNRMGTPDAVITLSGREATLGYNFLSEEDSGMTLHLAIAQTYGYAAYQWIDQRRLEQLGFDCTTKPGSPHAAAFYQRQRSRRAFVAFEYNGPAWRQQREEEERNRAAHNTPGWESEVDESRLVAVDADLQSDALRKRHPDRAAVLIVPALVTAFPDSKSITQFSAYFRPLASSIHVPRPFSDPFHSFKQPAPPYSVQLHFGTFHEPWVTAVEIP